MLRNERGEWELPGGKLEAGEDPEACLAREVREELNIGVRIGPVLDVWVYRIRRKYEVLVVTYGCFADETAGMERSGEHEAVGIFGPGEVESLCMPRGYKRSILTWRLHPASAGWGR